MTKQQFHSIVFHVFRGEEPPPPPPPAGGGEKVFKQEEVNKILAEERRQHQAKTQKALEELEALRTQADLTQKQRDELDGKLQSLRDMLKTKDEQEREKRERIENEFKAQVGTLSKERDNWRNRFETSTIKVAITQESVGAGAYDPDQIFAIIGPRTSLVEDLDTEGKPTGELVPTVEWTDIKDGKPVTLKLAVKDAVKRMSETERFFNLFKGKGSGGAGGGGGVRTGTGPLSQEDAARLARENPAEYRRLRAEGKLKL